MSWPEMPGCLLRLRYAQVSADSADLDELPDWSPLAGQKGALKPSIRELVVYDPQGAKIVVELDTVQVEVDADGWLCKRTGEGVLIPLRVAPTDDPLMTSQGWTYTLTLGTRSIGPISAPSSGVVELADYVTAPATDATKAWVERIPELVALIEAGSDPAGLAAAVEDYLTANPPAAAPDATTDTKGVLRLVGDLGGTADAPIVPGLADKADADHDHAIGDVTGLQSALDGKQEAGSYAAATHDHTAADIDSGAATDGHILTADGAGGAAWEAPPAGSGVDVGQAVEDYLTANPPSAGTSSGVTADDAPPAPAEGQTASYLVTSAVTWPADVIWSIEPDSGVAPVVTGMGIATLATVGGKTFGVLGSTYPATALDYADSTPPTAGTLTAEPVPGGLTLSVSGASDDQSLHGQPFAFSMDDGASWSAWQASPSHSASGLAAVPHSCRHKVRDAAGNEALGAAVTGTPGAASQLAVTFAGASPRGNDVLADVPWSYTAPIGAPTSTRRVILGITAFSNSASSWAEPFEILAGGVEPTLIGQAIQNHVMSGLWDISHLTGTDADISIPIHPVLYSVNAAVWVIDGAASTMLDLASASTEWVGGQTWREVVLDSEPGGVVLAAVCRRDPSDVTWEGVDDDFSSSGTGYRGAAGSGLTTAEQHTVRVTLSSDSNMPAFIGATFGVAQ